jgi:hypothetical protein
MTVFFFAYTACWTTACLIATTLYIKDRKAYAFSHADYWHFLLKRWKVITFVLAATGLTVIAPYTGDPTWDYFDALFMSLLTFLTAPWAVGVLYKATKKELPRKQAFVAACIWMFSASWSYDLYLLMRDGAYPETWLPNIFASSALYISAGLLWNLDWKREKGVFFSFMERDWPMPSREPVFMRLLWFALVFMILAAAVILPFILPGVF